MRDEVQATSGLQRRKEARGAKREEAGTARPMFSQLHDTAESADPAGERMRHLTAMYSARLRSASSAEFSRGLERTGSFATLPDAEPRTASRGQYPAGQDLQRTSLAISECRRGEYARWAEDEGF